MAGIGLCVGASLLALAGIPVGLLAPTVLLAAPVLAIRFLQDDERPHYLVFVMWLWLLTPWVRRVLDFASSYTEESLILLVAPVASLPGMVIALVNRPRVRSGVRRVFVVALVALVYATAAGAVRHGIRPGLVGGLVWLAPMGVGLWAMSTRCPERALRRAVGQLAVSGVVVLGGYGMYQFFLLPEWDAYWMDNVELVSIGRAVPLGVRVFGTLNAPVPYAMTLGALLIVASSVPMRSRFLTIAAGYAGLALSLVRAAWVGFVAALAALVAGGRERTVRSVLLLVVVPAFLLVFVGGPARDVILQRFDATVEKGSEDRSFSDRLTLYTETVPTAMLDVSGRGFGQVGAGAAAVDDEADVATLRSPDSAVLEALLSMGSLVGGAFLVAVTVGVVNTLRAARRSAFDRALGAALVGLLVQVPLGNPFNGAPAVLFWVLLAVAARSGSEGESELAEPQSPRKRRW